MERYSSGEKGNGGCLHEHYRYRAGPTRRDPAWYGKSVLKIVYVYMSGGEISIPTRRVLAALHPRSRLVGLEISHVNATRLTLQVLNVNGGEYLA